MIAVVVVLGFGLVPAVDMAVGRDREVWLGEME